MSVVRVRLAAMLCAAPALAAAQPVNPPQPQRGGTFHEPPPQVDPIYAPLGPNQPALPSAPVPPLSLRLALDLPLRRVAAGSGQGGQGSRTPPATLQLEARLRHPQEPGLFAQAVLFRYASSSRQRPWDPDFTYALGYERWEPGTLSLVYANYAGTRLAPDRSRGEGRFRFPQGQWSLGYKFALPPPLHPIFLTGEGDGALCSAEAHLTPRYSRAGGGALGSGKLALSLGCRYAHPDGWFAHLRAFAWPRGGQQQPWDPDYVYGFGWGDGRPGTPVLQYQNYSGNRWPGRPRGAGEGSPRSGSISVAWHW